MLNVHEFQLLLSKLMRFFYLFCASFWQEIDGIPGDLKELYKTVWEISQKTILKMAADRGAFIDQSQSLNIHIAEPNYGKLTSMHFFGWKQVSVPLLENAQTFTVEDKSQI